MTTTKPTQKSNSKTVKSIKTQPQLSESDQVKEKLLKVKTTIGVSLVPTETELTVISYGEIPEEFGGENEDSDGLMVYCITKKAKKEISYKSMDPFFKERDSDEDEEDGVNVELTTRVSVPTLLWGANISIPTGNGRTNPLLNDFFVFEIDMKSKEELKLRRWQMLNLNEDSYICFGDKKPSSCRKAFNMFWTMPFSDEDYAFEEGLSATDLEYLRGSYEQHRDMIKKVLSKPAECYDEEHLEWFNVESFGQKILSKDCDGFFLSNKQELLNIIPEKYQLQHEEQGQLVGGFAKKLEDDSWELTFIRDKKRQLTITLPAEKVTLT